MIKILWMREKLKEKIKRTAQIMVKLKLAIYTHHMILLKFPGLFQEKRKKKNTITIN